DVRPLPEDVDGVLVGRFQSINRVIADVREARRRSGVLANSRGKEQVSRSEWCPVVPPRTWLDGPDSFHLSVGEQLPVPILERWGALCEACEPRAAAVVIGQPGV